MNQNNRRGLYICLAMLMVVVFLVMSWFNSTTTKTKKEAEYDLIIADFLEDRVGEYQLDFNTRTLTYTLWEDMTDLPENGESGQSGENGALAQTSARSLLFPGARVPDSKTKTYRLPDNSLHRFVGDVHERCLEYNEEHPDRPIKVFYGYSDPSFLTIWLPVLLLVIAMVALWWMIMRRNKSIQ